MKISKGAIFIFISAVFWGTAGIFVNSLRDNYRIEALQIVLGRAFFTVIPLGIAMLLIDKRLFKIKIKDSVYFALTGIGSITLFNFCYFQTMKYTSLSVAAVLLYTAPIFVMIISSVFFKEKITLLKVVCCLLAVVGCAFVSGLTGSAETIGIKGIAYGLMTGFGYSLYGIFSGILIKKGYSSLTVNFYAFVFTFASVCLLLVKDLGHTVSLYTVGWQPVLIAFAMGLINTVIPYVLYAEGLKDVKHSLGIIIATVEPIVATLSGIVFYKQYPDVFGYIGIILVLGSVMVLNLSKGEQCEA